MSGLPVFFFFFNQKFSVEVWVVIYRLLGVCVLSSVFSLNKKSFETLDTHVV